MIENHGWIKLHRQMIDSKWGSNFEMMGFWTALLLMANHKPAYTWDGTLIKAGQLMTSREALSSRFKTHPSKIYRMLSALEASKQIEQQKSNKNTIITIVNWTAYQEIEQQTNNKRTTSEQRANTNKNEKNEKNNKNKNVVLDLDVGASSSIDGSDSTPFDASRVIEMFNEICGTGYRGSQMDLKHINARFNEGFDLNDFEAVIRSKHGEWAENVKMAHFLRPGTVFGTKFESYLQAIKIKPKTFEQKLGDYFASQGIKPQQI